MALFEDLRYKLGSLIAGRSLTTVEQYLRQQAGGGSAGVSVTEENARNLSAVYSCIKVLSESVAQLPVGYFQKTEKGAQPVNNRLNRLVANAPNQHMDSFTFREVLTRQAALTGDGLAIINRDDRGGAQSLMPIDSGELKEIKVSPKSGEPFYNFKNIKGDLKEEDVFHIKLQSPDGYRGESPLQAVEKEFASAIATQEFTNNFWANSAAPGLVVKVPEELSQEAYDRLRDSVQEFRDDRAGGVLPLDAGSDITSAALPQRDAQFLETMRFSKEQIASIYRVPPPLLMDLTNANFSNVTALYQIFVKSALIPWLRRFESELDRKIKPGSQDAANNYFRFDVDELLRGDATERSQFYRVMLREGVFTRNEVRRRENYNDIDVDEADQLFKQKQDVPLGTDVSQ